MRTKAAILYKLNKPLRVEEIEIPALQRGQVLVKMLASGICRSQLNEIKGFKGADKYLPHLIGHEGAGIVEKTGPGITKVKPGDYVVLSWIKGKGLDASGAVYRQGAKKINSGAVATLSEYTVASENRLVKIPRQIPPDKAALLGCAVATGAGIMLNTLKAGRDSSVAVIGVGGIGASAILAAKMSGCRRIVAIDTLKEKLAFAKRLGATETYRSGKKSARLSQSPVDFAVESSGSPEAMETAFGIIKDQGTAVIAGNLKKGTRISIDPFELIKGKKIIGTWGGSTVLDRDIPRYAMAYLEGKIKLGLLITHSFKLKDINRAFAVLEKGKAGRVMIRF